MSIRFSHFLVFDTGSCRLIFCLHFARKLFPMATNHMTIIWFSWQLVLSD